MIRPKSYIEDIPSYKPGKSIDEYVRERGFEPIKLASNENPFGPSKKVVDAVKKMVDEIHRYPDGYSLLLREKLASLLGIGNDFIIVTNGSNEAIELLCKIYLSCKDSVVVPYPTFSMYEIFSRIYGATVRKIPLVNYRVDFDRIIDAIDDTTKLVFLSNPNNPTGTIFRKREFEGFLKNLESDTLIVVDEAYFDFVEDPDFPDTISLVKSGYPVVVIRTFSKAYGLAGLRIGYAVADRDVISYMNRVRQPFNVNLLAQVSALFALDDGEYYEMVRRIVIDERKRLKAEISGMGFEVVESEANFLTINVGDGDLFYSRLLDRGVIVRSLRSFGMPEYIRVTIGKPHENDVFLKSFKEVANTT
ncbi:MAG: histidinol-phosphate transaminase [Thermosulfidibacteraceae bacterium]|jgi:histidinol-phosphate aminotransferase